MEQRIYTKATDRLIELHKNYGGAKSGRSETANWFDNTFVDDESGNFSAVTGPSDYYIREGYKQVSEQEFIDFMELEPKKQDNVNSPSHYTHGGIECIEAIKASLSAEGFKAYLKGNVQKYIWRYEHKYNPIEDLKKAQWYLNRLIKEEENESR